MSVHLISAPQQFQTWQVEQLTTTFGNYIQRWRGTNPQQLKYYLVDFKEMSFFDPTNTHQTCQQLLLYQHLFDALRQRQVISAYYFMGIEYCRLVFTDQFIRTCNSGMST